MRAFSIIIFLLGLTLTIEHVSYFAQDATFFIGDAGFKCLKNEGYLDQAFIFLTHNAENHTWEGQYSPERINNAGTIPDVVLILSGFKWATFSAEEESDYFAKQFANTKLRTIWLVPYAIIPSLAPSCSNIFDLASALKAKTGLTIGIFSNKSSWTKIFGSSTACQQLGNLPLFNYELEVTSPEAFGPWPNNSWQFQYIRTIRGTVCSIPRLVEVKKN